MNVVDCHMMTMMITIAMCAPVYHDDHRPHKTKATTEEEKVWTMGKHHWVRKDDLLYQIK